MADKLQHKNSAGDEETSLPAGFIAVCVLAFVAGVSATVYFCRSRCCEMEIPGGWMINDQIRKGSQRNGTNRANRTDRGNRRATKRGANLRIHERFGDVAR